MWFCSELIEGHFEWEGAGGEIKTDGKTAGPRAQQSTVFHAWSRCWSNPAASGSSHTSSPTEGSRPGSPSTRTSSERWWAEGLNSGILKRKKDGGHVIREHLPDGWYSVHGNGSSPPTGSLGLPVTNCRKSLCCSASKLLSTSNRNRTARLQTQQNLSFIQTGMLLNVCVTIMHAVVTQKELY